jgi:hypothetical protein
MKTSNNATITHNKQTILKKRRPDIRDDMDSRQNKESGYNGEQRSGEKHQSKKPI